MELSQQVDFYASKFGWCLASQKSSGTFAVESVLRIYSESYQLKELFVLGAAVFAGNMYEVKGLVKDPAYLFQVAASDRRNIIFRTYTQEPTLIKRKLFGKNDTSDTFKDNEVFESFFTNLKSKKVKNIKDYEEIRHHYLKCENFSSVIKLKISEKYFLEIEFPIKHINLFQEREMFQVETGPILFLLPNSFEHDDLYKGLVPCFIHFNKLNSAEITLDFPYGVRGNAVRGKMQVVPVDCEIKLFVDS